jgi:mannose-1-phosphate guanylyltransferase
VRAIVLVGGEGTRLRPLTWRSPKALVPVLDRPLLEHLLLHLKRHAISRITLAMTQRNVETHKAFGDGSALGIELYYAYEDTPLGSGGAIASVAQGRDDPFLLANGDIITDLDLTAMFAFHREHGAELTMHLHEVEDPSQFGVAVTAEDGFFPAMCESGRPIYGFSQPGYWRDIGNSEALCLVNLELAGGAIPGRVPDDTGGVFLGDGVTVADSAEVTRPTVIGHSSTTGSGAQVTTSLIWDGVPVDQNAIVRDSVLATGVTVGAGTVVERSMVAHGAQIEPGARVTDDQVEPDTQIEAGT